MEQLYSHLKINFVLDWTNVPGSGDFKRINVHETSLYNLITFVINLVHG